MISVLGDQYAALVRVSNAPKPSRHIILLSRHAIAHAAGSGGLIVHASASTLAVYERRFAAFEKIFTMQLKGFSPQAVSCGVIPETGPVVLLASAVGMFRIGIAEQMQNKEIPAILSHENLLPDDNHLTYVASALSDEGHVAGATIDGRLLIWSASNVYRVQRYSVAARITICKERSIHDRVTQLQFIPCDRKEYAMNGTRTTRLVVSWWSGHIAMYQLLGTEWSLAWSYDVDKSALSKGDANSMGAHSGTCVACKPDGLVVAVTSGRGVLTFLTAKHGSKIESTIAFPIPTSNSPCDVKGLVGDENGVLLLPQDCSGIIRVSWPTREAVEKASADASAKQALDASPSRAETSGMRLYEDLNYTLGYSRWSKRLNCIDRRSHIVYMSRTPFRNTAVELVRELHGVPGQDIQCCLNNLVLRCASFKSDVWVLCANKIVFVKTPNFQKWHAITSSNPVKLCAIAKGTGEQSESLLLLVHQNANASLWNVSKMLPALATEQLHVPNGIAQVLGCMRGTYTFAAVASEPCQPASDSGHDEIWIIHRPELARPHKLSLRLPETLFPEGVTGKKMHAFWYFKSRALLLIAAKPSISIAIDVKVAADSLSLARVKIFENQAVSREAITQEFGIKEKL